jgi:hypothetical protein
VRRLILLLATVAIAGLVVYRQRTIDRWERELGIDRSRPLSSTEQRTLVAQEPHLGVEPAAVAP